MYTTCMFRQYFLDLMLVARVYKKALYLEGEAHDRSQTQKVSSTVVLTKYI